MLCTSATFTITKYYCTAAATYVSILVWVCGKIRRSNCAKGSMCFFVVVQDFINCSENQILVSIARHAHYCCKSIRNKE
jgi:hypothetical protein